MYVLLLVCSFGYSLPCCKWSRLEGRKKKAEKKTEQSGIQERETKK